MKKVTLSLLTLAICSTPALAHNKTTYKHPLDPLNMKSLAALHYSDGAARADLGLNVSPNILARAHVTDEGSMSFGGGAVIKLSERDEWGTGLIRTGVSFGAEHNDFDEIGTKTSLDAKFVVSEYLNRQREFLLTGNIGGRYITTDYYNVEDSKVQFIAGGSAFYVKNPLYIGASVDAAVDDETAISLTPKIGYTVNNADFNVGYQYIVEGLGEDEVSFNATFNF
ncbi:hypothetical protein [Vibrio sp. D431a]|uniref:hypothetical protein n=1 Tax=Vibrio sp. D431a TaxID=2837388 RepID=UPI0025522A96|nr:hypothetical protein [Vibrio sp. D431a]MDK9790028.1 hypothetical protein [Vibrio sp. D431a]